MEKTRTLHSSSKRIPKLNKSFNGNVSPINTDSSSLIKYLCYGGGAGSPIPSPLATAKSSSSFIKSSSSSSFSPLSSIENVMIMSPSPSPSHSPPVILYRTPPMKVVDDDVLVMDGILLDSSFSRGSSRISRYLTSDSGGSGGSSSNSSSPAGIKVELCRSWENFGHCRYGSKCQFAHGKEELRPTCFNMKNKQKMQSSFKSPSPRSYAQILSPRSSSSPPPPDMTESGIRMGITINESEYPSLTTSTSPTINPCRSTKPRTLTNPEVSKKSLTSSLTNPEELPMKSLTIVSNYQLWSPLDDGIEVTLPGDIDSKSQSFKNEVDAHIDNVLNGPSTRKRLPVFSDFCPE